MTDLAAELNNRELAHIVIPGSHDTGTYGLTGSDHDYAGTQNTTEDITAALNQGIRQFDIRVKWVCQGQAGCDFFARHGDYISGGLRFSQELDQVEKWTLAPGHEKEIILLNLSIDTSNGQGDPSGTCKAFTDALGSALLTPRQLEQAYGIRDPADVTLGQLWSMPGKPRVIMDSAQCMEAGDPSAGQWSDDDLFGGYYANQCKAGPYDGWREPGVATMVLRAVQTRGEWVENDNPGTFGSDPNLIGPPKVGGFYLLNIQATTTADCLSPLKPFDLEAERQVLPALYQQWQTDADTRDYLNIVSGDFVEETDLVTYVIAMNQSWPAHSDTVTRLGPETVVVEQDQNLPDSFAASVAYQGKPVPYQEVTYRVSPADGLNGPNWGPGPHPNSSTEIADENGIVKAVGLVVGPTVGQFTLTAGVGDVSATWTLQVVPSSTYTLQPVPGNPTMVQVASTTPGGFAVRAANFENFPVPGVAVIFEAAAVGTFNGEVTATATTDMDGIARSPALTAGTRAGALLIVAAAPGSPSLSLPLTVTGGFPAVFVPLTGNLQTTPINSTFEIPLTGHYLDQYGNVTTSMPTYYRDFGLDNGCPNETDCATFPNGTAWVVVRPAADGTITLPALRAGQFVPSPNFVLVGAGPFVPNPVRYGGGGWILHITPGPPDAVTATGGDDQQTAKGRQFAQPLAARLTDIVGNPIPGAPITFQVTSGSATFPPLDLALLAAITGDPAIAEEGPVPPDDAVMVSTDANGIATAPTLTAGQELGQITVTAFASGVHAARTALFTLSVVGVPPTAPSITNLGNGDGQVSVGFSGATAGSSPITSYEVTATDVSRPDTPTVTTSGPSSPILVTGLINGDTYVFTVTATSADGTSPPSAPSGRLNVGVVPAVVSGPADGRVGQPYSSRFTITGAPPPTVTQISGDLPPGLTLASDGTITGIPTAVGSFTFTVQASNDVGIADATVTVTITRLTGPEASPTPTGSATSEGDGCNTVPVNRKRSGGALALQLSPVLLIWARRQRF